MNTALTVLPANELVGDYQANYWWTYPQPYVPPTVVISPSIIAYPVQTPRCAWCQGQHFDKCPRLKAVSYRADGTVERVEFFEEEGDQ